MKSFVTIFLFLKLTSAFAQDDDISKLSEFFKEFSPCQMPVFCYEYDFEVSGNSLIIETRLYNSSSKKLTETVEYSVPCNRINFIEYFPNNSQDVFIVMDDAVVKKVKNGVEERVSYLPIDFDKTKLSNENKKMFERLFHPLIKELGKK